MLCSPPLAVTLAVVASLTRHALGTMSFTVLSDPVKLRYGEVHNKVQIGTSGNGLPMPPDVVARYASGDKLMAISGFDPEMVRRHADGSETLVKLSDHYLHHYILYFGRADSMRSMLDLAAHSKHAAHKITGCHGMTGAGVHAFQEHLQAEGDSDHKWVAFGSAAGAEYRHNPQRFEAPYRIMISKPEVWAPTLHIINTNLADNRTNTNDAPVSRLLECPCTPQRKIDPAAGTVDGKKADPPIHCSKEFAATGNPSCHLSTYKGGWRCCEDGMFLIDTDKECKTPNCIEKFVDEVYMKFTFYYEDVNVSTRQIESAACCDVTGSGQGDMNIEHDVIPCAEGTAPEDCVYIAESVQPLAYYGRWSKYKASDQVDLVFAAPHLHWAGNSIQLFDHETNETLCEVHRTPDNSAGISYGTGNEPGNENGYMTGLTPCSWGGSKAPRFRRDHKLRTRAVYNATTYHTGVMSLWLMEVAAVDEIADVVV